MLISPLRVAYQTQPTLNSTHFSARQLKAVKETLELNNLIAQVDPTRPDPTLLARIQELSGKVTAATARMGSKLQGMVNRTKHDVLLRGLLTRREFEKTAKALVKGEKPTSLVFIDLDFFGPINKKHGMCTGDKVLQEVARKIARVLRSEDIVARTGRKKGATGDKAFRLGGEELAILLPNTDEAGAAVVTERILKSLPVFTKGIRNRLPRRKEDKPHALQPLIQERDLSASIGVVTVPPGLKPKPTEMLSWADTALRAAKSGTGVPDETTRNRAFRLTGDLTSPEQCQVEKLCDGPPLHGSTTLKAPPKAEIHDRRAGDMNEITVSA